MKAAKLLVSAAASAAVAGVAAGQGPAQFPALTPPVSTVPPPLMTAPPFPNSTGIAPQPAPPTGSTIWSRLGLSQEQREFCRRNACRTPFGQLMGRIRAPLTRISGGLIPPFCPITPSLAELQDPGVIGAAAKVKQDRAGAAQRIEAIKLLAGVDCAYWPEAEEALIGALRTDRNECVRFEAALALGKGCCCTCKVIVALSHTVCCSDKDGGFMEKSARVRSAAAEALERCIASGCCASELPPMVPVPEVPKTPEGPEGGTGDPMKEKGKDGTTSARFVSVAQAKPGPDAQEKPSAPLTFADYYRAVPRVPREQVLSNAMRALDIGRQIGHGFTTEANPADYEAAGMATPRETFSMMEVPANLWDKMTRRTPQRVMPASTMMMGETAVVPASATRPRPALPAAPAAKTAPPVATRTVAPVEPPKAVPVQLPAAPKAVAMPEPRVESKPAPAKPPVQPAAVATPAPIKPAPQPEARVIPPASQPEVKVIPPAPRMEPRLIPVMPAPAAKPMPVAPAPEARPMPVKSMPEARVIPPAPKPEPKVVEAPAAPGIAKVPAMVTLPPVVPTTAPMPVTVQPPVPAPVARPAPATVPDDEIPAEPVPLNRGAGYR